MTVTYGAFVVSTLNAAPRGFSFTRRNMTRQGRRVQQKVQVQNPRLRELAEAAYQLRTQVKPNTTLYNKLTAAVRGNPSVSTLAILEAMDERAGTGLLRSFGKGLPPSTTDKS